MISAVVCHITNFVLFYISNGCTLINFNASSTLISIVDQIFVIATNSSMSRLDCSPDSVSLTRRRQSFLDLRFRERRYAPRVRDLRHNRATTRSLSNSVPRLSIPLWNAMACVVNERALYSRISTRFESGRDFPWHSRYIGRVLRYRRDASILLLNLISCNNGTINNWIWIK